MKWVWSCISNQIVDFTWFRKKQMILSWFTSIKQDALGYYVSPIINMLLRPQ